MTRPFVPQAVVDLAHARREARVRRDWDEADGYRAQIEAAGWLVVDRGVDFDLRPARQPDEVADGETRYGSSASVPSRLDEPDGESPTRVVVVDDAAAVRQLGATLGAAGAGAASADGTGAEAAAGSLVVVANGIGTELDDDLRGIAGRGAEVVRLAVPSGPAVAINAGCRRATGSVIAILSAGGAHGRSVTDALVAALADPEVAIAGTVGLVSAGLPRFAEATAGPIHAVSGDIGFRRADFRIRGPLDERYQGRRELDTWWSLVLRDEPDEDAGDDPQTKAHGDDTMVGPARPPRRAALVGDRHALAPVTAPRPPESTGERRDRYRILERFRDRDGLFAEGTGGADRA